MTEERHPAITTAVRFFEAVRDRDWGAALNNTLVSWCEGIPPEFEDRVYIEAVLGGLRFDGFEITCSHEVKNPVPPSSRIVDVGFVIDVGGKDYAGTVRVSNGGGRWGVNPMSALTQLMEA